MNQLLALPILIPLAAAALSILLRSRPDLQRRLGVLAAACLLASGGALLAAVGDGTILTSRIGGWPPPFGITLVADTFAGVMVLMAGIIGLCVAVYSLEGIDARREAFGYHPLVQVLLMGVCGAFLTGDVFNLFVWFEVMLIASFVLIALGGERAQMEGAIKYVTLNLLSSTLFLSAIGILYGVAGTLNMADLARKLPDAPPGVAATLAVLFLVAFGIKAAAFPLFFWLPASYHTPPVVITALFSGLLTKVGAYALIRFYTLIFVSEAEEAQGLILVVGGLTMVTGVLGAVAQYDFRRLLAFHIISQIGYLIMGLGLHTALALAGVVFFMAHVIAAKSALFLVSGIARRYGGTYDLKRLGGLYQARPVLAALFLLPALSMAGMPPLSGFVAKLALVRAGLETGSYAITATALAVSILTLFSMIKIWTEAFWKPEPDDAPLPTEGPAPGAALFAPVAALAAVTVLLGVAAGPCFAVASLAGQQLMDPGGYVRAVFGSGG